MGFTATYTISCTIPGLGSHDVSADFQPIVSGSWTLKNTGTGCRLKWDQVFNPVWITNGSWSFNGDEYHYGPITAQLAPGAFPSTRTGSIETANVFPYEHGVAGTFTLLLTFDPKGSSGSHRTRARGSFAARSTGRPRCGWEYSPYRCDFAVQIDAALPNDVRLCFPSSKRELWSSVATLSAASPYFKASFSSGFAEAEMRIHAESVEEEDVAMEDHIDEDSEDSDAETDRTLAKKLVLDVNSERSSSAYRSLPFHDVVIKDTSFTTYRSVLVWIYSGDITFAPLTSTFEGDRDVRLLKIEATAKEAAHLPLPASPKSVYRLAHYLELKGLKKLALASIKSQITVENVAYELFSNLGRRYPEVQKMEMQFAIDNWTEVKASEGLRGIQSACEAGVDSTAGPVFAKIAMCLPLLSPQHQPSSLHLRILVAHCDFGACRLEWKDVVGTISIVRGSCHFDKGDGYGSATSALAPGPFPPTPTGTFQLLAQSHHNFGRSGGSFRVDFALDASRQPEPANSLKFFAIRSTEHIDSAYPNDVRFYFPSTKQELWASVSTLSAASPYFKALFASGFAEGTMKEYTGIVEDQDEATEDGLDREDSDGETDRDVALKAGPSKLLAKTPTTRTGGRFHDVVIKHTSYTTYRSVLVWIYSQHITFARLRSSFPHELDKALHPEKVAAEYPLLPVPTSPKSVYRLAHYLEMKELKDIALKSIKSQITVGNVAHELFSNLGRTYPEVQAMEMGFAIENWAKVKVTEGMKEVQRMCEEGEDPTACPILARLVMRLS